MNFCSVLFIDIIINLFLANCVNFSQQPYSSLQTVIISLVCYCFQQEIARQTQLSHINSCAVGGLIQSQTQVLLYMIVEQNELWNIKFAQNQSCVSAFYYKYMNMFPPFKMFTTQSLRMFPQIEIKIGVLPIDHTYFFRPSPEIVHRPSAADMLSITVSLQAVLLSNTRLSINY